MGLDTFAARSVESDGFGLTAEDLDAFVVAGVMLCRGAFTGDESGFRGKVYDSLIRAITDESLYQEWIPPEEVRKIWDILEKCDPEAEFERNELLKTKYTLDDVIELRKFFRVCAERGLGLVGWL